MPNSNFHDLPLHLLSIILTELDCMQSLGSAILSHSSMYTAFCDNTKHIVQCILSNQIPPELMHYAAAAFESDFVDNRNSSRVGGLLMLAFEGLFRAQNGAPFQQWCLDWMFNNFLSGYGVRSIFCRNRDTTAYAALDAKTIASIFSRTHTIVDHFCTNFLSDRLPLSQDLLSRQRPGNRCPSNKELFRIRRAIYLFQIYCNVMFQRESDFRPDWQTKQNRKHYLDSYFFGSFSPWVKEQLACVHDYLEEVLSRAFDEIAAHDIQWGAKSVDWLAQGRLNEHKQAYLSYGLSFLFQLDTNPAYEQRLRMLDRKGLPRTPVALAAHLERASPFYIDPYHYPGSVVLGDRAVWTPRQLTKLMGKSDRDHDGIDGVESGPCRIWLETYKDFLVSDTSYWPENSYLRKCGYVMWDIPESEAEAHGVDEKVRKWIVESRRQGLVEKIERNRGREKMKRSWKERAILYDQGKRGYWNPDSLGLLEVHLGSYRPDCCDRTLAATNQAPTTRPATDKNEEEDRISLGL